MELLERDSQLQALDALLADAARGRGSLALLAGEAGIGKSVLARTFVERHRTRIRLYRGACDALDTPRPLGPFYDIARLSGGDFAAVMASDASLHERLSAFLDLLAAEPGPVVVVLEDAHWADAATRDALIYVARRIADTHALVLVTYRDDEVGPEHPLRAVLGHLTSIDAVHRIRLDGLSVEAVSLLVGRDAAARMHERTGGNPFFVTELIASGVDDHAPATIADAVLARAARLRPRARSVLEVAAMIPDAVEVALLRSVGDSESASIDECIAHGLLVEAGTKVRFRHELARLAVEQAVPAAARQELHARILEWLHSDPGVEPARLVHHAEAAGDVDAVLRFAPVAAERASSVGARREAVRHYEHVLRHADRLDPRAHAELLERYMKECTAISRHGEANAARKRALEIWAEIGDVERRGWLLARYSGGGGTERMAQVREAVEMLDALPPGPAMAFAWAQLSYVLMLARQVTESVDVGLRAVELAERVAQPEALARALNAVGSSLWFVDPDRAEAPLLRSLEVARRAGDADRFGDAMVNMGSAAGEVRRYTVAARWLRELLDWSTSRDADALRDYAMAWLGRVQVEQGSWQQAEAMLDMAAESDDGISRIVCLTAMARLKIRRGDPGARLPLEEGWRLAVESGDLQRLWPAATARAEASWLAGQPERIDEMVRPVYRMAVELDQPWAIGELAYWLAQSGADPGTDAERAAEPYALMLAGEWRRASALWAQIGCPYEEALALLSGDAAAVTRAVDISGRLGARPLGDLAAARLRALGVGAIPRRPSRRTAQNPAGLTYREIEVLAQVAAGRTNPEIAAALHISPKTVGHHVSALLDKLGVAHRRDAAQRAGSLGIPPAAE